MSSVLLQDMAMVFVGYFKAMSLYQTSSMRMSAENNDMHHIEQSVFILAKSSLAFLHFFFLTRLQSAGRPLYTVYTFFNLSWVGDES